MSQIINQIEPQHGPDAPNGMVGQSRSRRMHSSWRVASIFFHVLFLFLCLWLCLSPRPSNLYEIVADCQVNATGMSLLIALALPIYTLLALLHRLQYYCLLQQLQYCNLAHAQSIHTSMCMYIYSLLAPQIRTLLHV